MLQPTGAALTYTEKWSMKLRHTMRPGLVTAGLYDGVNPRLTSATDGGKVFVHDMQARRKRLSGVDTGSEYELLNLSQVTGLLATDLAPATDAAASAKPGKRKRDKLFIGTPTSLTGYDVLENKQEFHRDVLDGVNALAAGVVSGQTEPLLFAGGSCSVLGVDQEGADKYWTVTGDNVQALCINDFDMDGQNELLAGSDDFDIRVLKDDQILAEIAEVDGVTDLCPLYRNVFAFSLANGSIGVYGGKERFWRAKTRNFPTALLACDIDEDGVPEIITGWSKGRLDFRRNRTGDLMMKNQLPSGVSGLVLSDYDNEGKETVVCCCMDGEVSAYEPSGPDRVRLQSEKTSVEDYQLKELRQQKQALLLKIKAVEETKEAAKTPVQGRNLDFGVLIGKEGNLTAIHHTTGIDVSMTFKDSQGAGSPAVTVRVIGDKIQHTYIKAVVLFAEGVFENESHFVYYPSNMTTQEVEIPVRPMRDVQTDVLVKAFIGPQFTQQFHVFEKELLLPQFSMLVPIKDKMPLADVPKSFVGLHIPGVQQRNIWQWIAAEFLVHDETWVLGDMDMVYWKSLRHDFQPVVLKVFGTTGKLCIYTNLIQVAGDIVQALTNFLHQKDVLSECYFPDYEEYIAECFERVREQDKACMAIRTDIADHSNLIRGLVVRAEDARLTHDMSGVRQAYKSLHDFNLDLVKGYNVRCATFDSQQELQRQLNMAVQTFSKTRAGKHRAETVASSKAIMEDDTATGHDLAMNMRGRLNISAWDPSQKFSKIS